LPQYISFFWAFAFDWADGLIARRIKNRSGSGRVFGGQLYLVIDIVGCRVAPTVLLMSCSDFNPAFLSGAFLMIAASAIRLNYFSTFALSDKGQYTGVALDNNNVFLVFLFLFEGFFSTAQFSIVVYVFGVLLACLNVAQIKTPKLSGNPRNVYMLVVHTLVVITFYAWRLSVHLLNSPT
jgi:CDP-diacylglycerol--serine O-phosphatidyltransferase